MKKKSHIWIAVRAVDLLARDEETATLAALLRPLVSRVAIGAWLPDEKYFKNGSGSTQNHVLKMKPYAGADAVRFIQSREETCRKLGPHRKLTGFMEQLPADFWTRPYRGDCDPGRHPADCAAGLATALTDLLLLGDAQLQSVLDDIVPEKLPFPKDAQTSVTQAALYFFMMSHFAADAQMPCHADARVLARYDAPLHAAWEKHFDDQLDAFPNPDKVEQVPAAELLTAAVKAFPLELPSKIPSLKKNVWEEIIQICRASFALNCLLVPPEQFPFDGPERVAFKAVFSGPSGARRLQDVTYAILHDSVLGVAMLWKHVWKSLR
ncbi:hypothetical protein [Hyalangium gracile]|uniref:hypothetical protein n=1 Tax=Hyalangium gracile TaxID=394092 RepID=UPI001CCE0C18|nr:hypothetical protein [Hyalangium gracile]